MKKLGPLNRQFEDRAFLSCLLLVTGAFVWLMTPFFGAILWATLLTLIFYPLHERLKARFELGKSASALLTMLLSVLIVVVPLLLVSTMLAAEGAVIYDKVNKGEINLRAWVDRARDSIPYIDELALHFDIDLNSLKQTLTDAALKGSRFLANQAFSIGQQYIQFSLNFVIMLYLIFFFLRDGEYLIQLMIRALPLGDDRERHLFSKFAEVSRATIKGNLVVAAVQGSLGGLIFWVLGIQGAIIWGVVMMFLSMLPAVGSALVWVPAAVYLLVNGETWQGIVLALFGFFVIGLVDNILRPILVGRDTKLPDYIILLSTLGGLMLFGINGFVIGPIIAALFVSFWQIFMDEINVQGLNKSGD